ncbi:NlpC/P60 family protein [Actinokineospora sp.]|uniref:NlpC/P60 family protein n=1 Tax=Actinokineospora sp. TaxID=1872133 RepID=UPI003D6A129C
MPNAAAGRIARATVFTVTIGLAAWGVFHFARQVGGAADGQASTTLVTDSRGADPAGPLRYERLSGPDRTVVRTSSGAVLATLTDGARTAAITGPRRTLSEPKTTTASVVTSTWVRLLPGEWRAGEEDAPWFGPWLAKARDDREPDLLAIATQYLDGAPNEHDGNGVRFRGDAAFGPVAASGVGRLERSDFVDYLGVTWTFPDGAKRKPDRTRHGAADCSGFVRLVFGYRGGYPLLGGNDPGPGLPRRAYAMAESGPGVVLVPNTHTTATDYARLQPGDLVFFESEDDDTQVDHSGIYLGIDTYGHHRFVSSRERANGPTMGDLGGTSLLDDGGHYSRAWRTARRV